MQVKEGFSASDNQQSELFSEKGQAPSNADFVNKLSLKDDDIQANIVNIAKGHAPYILYGFMYHKYKTF